MSRGARSTFSLSTNIFRGRLLIMTLGPEQPTTYQDEDLVLHQDIARQVLFGSEERCPTLPSTNVSPQRTHDRVPAVFFQKCRIREFEVFVDGSMRVPTKALEHTFPQPKSHQKATYAKDGILFHPVTTPLSTISSRDHDFSITTRNGPSLGLCSSSSIELYTILMAIYCMESAQLSGTIYTDYHKAVRIANDPSLLHSMGRKGNPPLFQYLLPSLHRLPNVRLVHVKAHEDVKKQLQWTRPQWGNCYADLIAKNQESAFSYDHVEMDLLPIEQLVWSSSPWHWALSNGHLALEPLLQLIRKGTHLSYMRDRDRYQAQRGNPPKWQYAKVGLLNDTWKLNHSSLRAKAYAHRLIYDKGWHGRNRGKAPTSTTNTPEEWVACGLCGMKDSQDH